MASKMWLFLKKRLKLLVKSGVTLAIGAVIFFGLINRTTPDIHPIYSWLSFAADLPFSDQVESVIIDTKKTDSQFEIRTDKDRNLIYYSIANEGRKTIHPQVIINGQDWSTDKAMLSYAFKNIDLKSASNQEKILAVFKFITDNNIHWHTPIYSTTYYFLNNPVRYLNVWGYGFCSDSSTVLIQLLTLAGYNARLINLVDHIVAEVFYDGAWHMLDPDMEAYYLNSNGKIAAVVEIAEYHLLLDSPIWLREVSNDTKKLIRNILEKAYSQPAQAYTPAERGMTSDDYRSELKFHLKRGEEIRYYYDFPGKFFWSYNDEPPPEYTNGILISKNRGGLITISLPYPILAAYLYKPGLCRSVIQSRISLNGWRWQELLGCQDDIIKIDNLFPIGANTLPTEKYFLLLPPSFNDYQLITRFQASPKSIPRPVDGVNEIQLKQPVDSVISVNFGYARIY